VTNYDERLQVKSSHDKIFHRALKADWPVVSHGDGVYIFDTEGRKYLDACAGVHVVSIGHGVPQIGEAMRKQSDKVCFPYGRFLSEPQIELAARVAEMAPGDLSRVFFVSGGSEATEAAMKMARKYHVENGDHRKYKVITRWQSWHGNTIGALSMSGRSVWRNDYAPYLLDFPHITAPIPYRCPYCSERNECQLNCAEELERTINQEGSENISAFIAEPVLGTSCAGVAPPPEYFRIVREICDRHNILFIADEVVTGFGRTGLDFGIQHWDVTPDIIATGKGLSSGYTPIAATIASDRVYDAIYRDNDTFVHGHTYGGNALSCAVALAVQNYVREHDLVTRCRHLGDIMLRQMKAFEELSIVGEVRGKGLLIGVEFVTDKTKRTPFDPQIGLTGRIVNRCMDKGVLIMPGAPGLIDGVKGDHIAVSPPFTITEEEIAHSVDVIRESIEEIAVEI
jgi:adenosylmethionine-8-amino-7-oxononanoate aminotransferase